MRKREKTDRDKNKSSYIKPPKFPHGDVTNKAAEVAECIRQARAYNEEHSDD